MEETFQRGEALREADETQVAKACRQFREMNPPIFQGDSDPLKADAWLLTTEQIFTLLQITDDDLRVAIATCYLRDTAALWWVSQKELFGQTRLTWEAFRTLFLETYFPDTLQDRKYMEFINLVQGNLSVHEYQLKFNTLARYAPECVATERRRCQQFERGLHSRINIPVAAQAHKTFTQSVNSAINVETAIQRIAHHSPQTRYYPAPILDNETKGATEGSSQGSQKKRSRDSSSPSPLHLFPLSAKVQKGSCYNCGQYGHFMWTCSSPITCRICGIEGHIQTSCPKIVCYFCNNQGHMQSQCPKKKF